MRGEIQCHQDGILGVSKNRNFGECSTQTRYYDLCLSEYTRFLPRLLQPVNTTTQNDYCKIRGFCSGADGIRVFWDVWPYLPVNTEPTLRRIAVQGCLNTGRLIFFFSCDTQLFFAMIIAVFTLS